VFFIGAFNAHVAPAQKTNYPFTAVGNAVLRSMPGHALRDLSLTSSLVEWSGRTLHTVSPGLFGKDFGQREHAKECLLMSLIVFWG
jgi:hypothetical protein